eukprot:2033475-Amphidinium_carterae.1
MLLAFSYLRRLCTVSLSSEGYRKARLHVAQHRGQDSQESLKHVGNCAEARRSAEVSQQLGVEELFGCIVHRGAEQIVSTSLKLQHSEELMLSFEEQCEDVIELGDSLDGDWDASSWAVFRSAKINYREHTLGWQGVGDVLRPCGTSQAS